MPRAVLDSVGFTITGSPISCAASHASFAERTTVVFGTGTPQVASSDRVSTSSRVISCAIALVWPVSEVQMRCCRAP